MLIYSTHASPSWLPPWRASPLSWYAPEKLLKRLYSVQRVPLGVFPYPLGSKYDPEAARALLLRFLYRIERHAPPCCLFVLLGPFLYCFCELLIMGCQVAASGVYVAVAQLVEE